MIHPPRVVLDTDVVLSALVFRSESATRMRRAWQSGSCRPLVSTDTTQELLRVLAYPKFKLTREEQQALLAEFLPYVETVQIDTTPDGLPDIRDADDTIFLVLAAVGEADALVSGEGDIQALKAQFHIPILTMAEFADWLQAH